MSRPAAHDPDDWSTRLRRSPELLAFDIDPASEAVGLIALSRMDYEKASFLDGRLQRAPDLTPEVGALEAAAAGLPIASDFIFHIGHVGSTLISRLLGTHPRVFCLREPQALRTFAAAQGSGPWSEAEWRRRLALFLALYSRTWTSAQRSLIKATSLVSEISGPLLELSPGARALMVIVRPETYLATILGGPNSRLELAHAAPARAARLARRAEGLRLEGLSEGELAAMSWACETSALAQAAADHADRTTWIDFDHFLGDPAAGVARALSALHGRADPQEVAALAASPYFGRYSKAPEYAYGPNVRAEVLAEARRTAGPEIRRGLDWLHAAAAQPAVSLALRAADLARR